MGLRQILLDVDKARERPDIVDIAKVIENIPGVDGLCIVVNEIDIETVGMEITIEGEDLDYAKIVSVIEKSGAVVHSLDQLIAGKRMVAPVRRTR